jgi:hypothetical protein
MGLDHFNTEEGEQSMEDVFRVNQAARQLGISESWLRRAEERGVIPAARRDFNGWRIYSAEDLRVIKGLLFPFPNTTDQGIESPGNRRSGQHLELQS